MRKRSLDPLATPLLFVVLGGVALLLAACGGSEQAAPPDPGYDAAAELDTGYDATLILERLCDRGTYEDPELVAALAADFNALKDSRDFYTARRQVKELSVDFRNRPMRASMAAAIMDRWNQKPPGEITPAHLEQAWEIRREEKKSEEQLALEAERRLRDRQDRQTEVLAQRERDAQAREQQKVDVMGEWVASYNAATEDGRSALARVLGALSDPAKKDDLGAACKDLFQATQDMDGRVFQAPHPNIATPLAKAWERYRSASRSCMKGELAYLTSQLNEGEAARARVNQILADYGRSI